MSAWDGAACMRGFGRAITRPPRYPDLHHLLLPGGNLVFAGWRDCYVPIRTRGDRDRAANCRRSRNRGKKEDPRGVQHPEEGRLGKVVYESRQEECQNEVAERSIAAPSLKSGPIALHDDKAQESDANPA